MRVRPSPRPSSDRRPTALLIRLDLPKAASPVLDELDPVRLRSVQEVLLDPSLVLRAVRADTGRRRRLRVRGRQRGGGRQLEVALDDLVGSLLSITLPVPTGAFLLEECIEAVGTGVSLRFDDYVVDDVTRGGTRHFDIRGLPVDDRVVFTWRDVSDRFRNEQALAESRNRYRLLAENASDVVVLLATDGTMEWVSPSVGSQLGWDPDDLVGRPVADIVHAEDRVRLGSMRRHPTAGRASTEEIRMRCAGGAQLWVSATLRDALDAEGRVVSRVLSLRNIDKKVQTRRELENSEARFRTLAENVSDVVFATTAGRFTWVSPSVEWVLGWPPEELVGRAVMDLICRGGPRPGEGGDGPVPRRRAPRTPGDPVPDVVGRRPVDGGALPLRPRDAGRLLRHRPAGHRRAARPPGHARRPGGRRCRPGRGGRRGHAAGRRVPDPGGDHRALSRVVLPLARTTSLWWWRPPDGGAEALVAGDRLPERLRGTWPGPRWPPGCRVGSSSSRRSAPPDGDPDPFGSWRTNLGVPVRVDGTVDLAFGMHLAATYGPDPEGSGAISSSWPSRWGWPCRGSGPAVS